MCLSISLINVATEKNQQLSNLDFAGNLGFLVFCQNLFNTNYTICEHLLFPLTLGFASKRTQLKLYFCYTSYTITRSYFIIIKQFRTSDRLPTGRENCLRRNYYDILSP